MKQLTRYQAIALAEGNICKDWSSDEIVRLQLFQDRLCMDFSKFHEAIEVVLGRSVWTHEFAFCENLRAEYLGIKQAPTFEEIINQIPEEKRLTIFVS